jgi:hypothetical protein
MEEQHLCQLYAPIDITQKRSFTFPPTPPSPTPLAPQWSTYLPQPLDTMFGYSPFQPCDRNQVSDTSEGNIYQEEDFMTSPNGMSALDGANPSPSNSGEVSNKDIQSKYTLQEVDFSLLHNHDCSNADTIKRYQYQTHVNQCEMLSHCMTGNGETALQNSRKCHQNTQQYKTKFAFKQSYLQSSESEENRCLEYSNRSEIATNHLQNPSARNFKEGSVMLQNNLGTHSQHEQDVGSYDSDVMMLQEDGSIPHQQVTVDDIKSMSLSQEDGLGDIFATAEAFDHTTSVGHGGYLHSHISASAQGLGESLYGTCPLFSRIYRWTELFMDTLCPYYLQSKVAVC